MLSICSKVSIWFIFQKMPVKCSFSQPNIGAEKQWPMTLLKWNGMKWRQDLRCTDTWFLLLENNTIKEKGNQRLNARQCHLKITHPSGSKWNGSSFYLEKNRMRKYERGKCNGREAERRELGADMLAVVGGQGKKERRGKEEKEA